MTTKTKVKYGTRRKAIENKALELFATRGVDATTTREITDCCDCAEGTLFRHYKTKDELAVALFKQSMGLFTQYLSARIKDEANSARKMECLIEGFFRFAMEYPLEYAYVTAGHERAFKRMPKIEHKPKDVFAQTIEEGMRVGAFKKRDVNLSAAMIIGMVSRVHYFSAQKMLDVSEKETLKHVKECALKILR